jgi:hypothetical protein
MSGNFTFIPLKFNWVALNPNPKGVVYFIGGAFFGSFPNIFYRYLLKKIFEEGYTVVAIPFRFTFRHWSVSIEIARGLIDLRKDLYSEALFRGYTDNINIYNEDPILDKFNYLWVGHSLGCKYISLLEILTGIDEPNLKNVLQKCTQTKQAKEITKSLGELNIENISLENQPSLFLAPVIAGIQNAIPFPPLASLANTLGLDVQPSVEETRCLIINSPLFNLIGLITFIKDVRAKETIDWFITHLAGKISSNKSLCGRNHLSPLGWQNGDDILAENVIKSITSLSLKLLK